MIVDLKDGQVWLTISQRGAETLIHGAFTSKEFAERCAAEVAEDSFKRDNITVGSWKINESCPDCFDDEE
jgi:hypothetical protein